MNRQSELIAAYRKFIWEIYVDVIAIEGITKTGILEKINTFMDNSSAWQTFNDNIKNKT